MLRFPGAVHSVVRASVEKDCGFVGCRVLNRLRHSRLLLARTPPCCILDLLHHGRFSLHFYVTLRPATTAAVTSLLLTGSPLHGGPHMEQSRPTPHVPQPLLHCVRRHVPAWHFTDSDVALLTEQARGVYGRCDPCLHGPLHTRNGKRPHAIQRTCDDTCTGPHEDTLTASSGAALRR